MVFIFIFIFFGIFFHSSSFTKFIKSDICFIGEHLFLFFLQTLGRRFISIILIKNSEIFFACFKNCETLLSKCINNCVFFISYSYNIILPPVLEECQHSIELEERMPRDSTSWQLFNQV